MKTSFFSTKEVPKKWYVIDAQDKILGRLLTRVAMIVRGKNKPQFTPNADTGDFVIIINADKIKFTGNKLDQKTYYRHSGHISGLKSVKADDLMKKYPQRVIQNALKGMLPKNRLGRKLFKKVKVYAGPDHPHAAQKPEILEI